MSRSIHSAPGIFYISQDALCSLLKRDVRESFKSKGNCLVSVMATNVLYAAFQDLSPWPIDFLRCRTARQCLAD